ncbi:hypothetical protein [Psychrobacter sp.]|uniref:hypothetical protein n=1 Tax=Psychrobacter sp. TaxID=56811 RepID=UPI003F94D5A6
MSIINLKQHSRLALTGYHLLYSLILSVIVTALIYFIWYPDHLYQATGVLFTASMMIAFNLIVAPLVTFIIYKDNKQELARDLIVVLLLQIAALIYGLYVVESGRPYYLVFAENDFEVVSSFDNEWARSNLSTELNAAESLGLFEKPKFVYSVLSEDKKTKVVEKPKEFFMRVPTIYRTDSYQEIETAANIIQSKAKQLSTLTDSNDAQKVKSILSHYPDADGWLPLKATVLNMVVLTDIQGMVIDIVDLRPQ